MIMTAPLFVGVDGGGTRCRARICDASGRILGEGVAGSANTRLGLDQVFGEIRAACQTALAEAGLGNEMLAQLHAGLGLAGLQLASERDEVMNHPHPFAGMVAASDAYVACLGAHAGADGAILIIGTGSCGCAIVRGRVHTVGGWGFSLSDQGSGAVLGWQTVRRALWAHENVIAATELSRVVMARFDDSIEQAVLWSDQARPRDYGALVPLVFEHARRGDPLARELLAESAADTARLIRALLARGAPSVVLLGGLAEPIVSYLPDDVRAELADAQGDAMDGALLMARRHYRETAA